MMERWKIIDGENAIVATVTFDDPGAFNAPWSGRVGWTMMGRLWNRCARKTTRTMGNSSAFPNIQCRSRTLLIDFHVQFERSARISGAEAWGSADGTDWHMAGLTGPAQLKGNQRDGGHNDRLGEG